MNRHQNKVPEKGHSAMKPKHVGLHINELVLRGFSANEGNRIAQAAQTELNVLLTERGISEMNMNPRDVERLTCPTLHVPPGARAESIGIRLAHSIYRGLSDE